MNTVFWAFITFSFMAAVGVFIFVMIELRGATRGLREFLKTTENSLKPTLEELQQTLKSMRNVTENVTDVTEDIKELSGSVRDVGKNVRQVSELIGGVTSSTAIKVCGLRAGINAGLDVLLRNLFSRGKELK